MLKLSRQLKQKRGRDRYTVEYYKHSLCIHSLLSPSLPVTSSPTPIQLSTRHCPPSPDPHPYTIPYHRYISASKSKLSTLNLMH